MPVTGKDGKLPIAQQREEFVRRQGIFQCAGGFNACDYAIGQLIGINGNGVGFRSAVKIGLQGQDFTLGGNPGRQAAGGDGK